MTLPEFPTANYHKPSFDAFWYWINERHLIYNKSKVLKSPKPWTKDEILQSYRFCNVYRELDKVTIWTRKHWREPYKDHPNLWFAMVVARLFNWIPTLEAIGFPMDEKWVANIEGILGDLQEKQNIYGAAYIITAGGQSGPKYQYSASCLRAIWRNPPPFARKGAPACSIRTMWDQLKDLPSCGPFVAYEIATDLRWSRYYDRSDHMLWANAGPGAKRGISRIWTGQIGTKPRDCNVYMRHLLNISARYLAPGMKPLEMRDIEHSLCEVDKYLRAKYKEGRPKAKYNGV